MSTDFYTTTPIARTRKSRHCYWCPEPIPIGTAAVRLVGRWEGTFGTLYVHLDCEEAWKRDPCNDDGEGCHYDHLRGMTCAEMPIDPPWRGWRDREKEAR